MKLPALVVSLLITACLPAESMTLLDALKRLHGQHQVRVAVEVDAAGADWMRRPLELDAATLQGDGAVAAIDAGLDGLVLFRNPEDPKLLHLMSPLLALTSPLDREVEAFGYQGPIATLVDAMQEVDPRFSSPVFMAVSASGSGEVQHDVAVEAHSGSWRALLLDITGGDAATGAIAFEAKWSEPSEDGGTGKLVLRFPAL